MLPLRCVTHSAARQRLARFQSVAWLLCLLSALVVTVLHYSAPSLAWQEGAALLSRLAAFVAILLGLRGYRPQHRRAWLLLAGAQLLWAASVLSWSYGATGGLGALEIGFYLVAELLLIVALFQLTQGEQRWPNKATLVDTAITTLGLSVLLWPAMSAGIPADSSTALWPRFPIRLYPLLDLLLLLMAIRLVFSVRRWVPALVLLVAASVIFPLSNSVLWLAEQGGRYRGEVLLVAWVGASCLFAMAALHPSMPEVRGQGSLERLNLTMGRLLILGGSAMLPALLSLVDVAFGLNYFSPTFSAVVTIVVILLLILRVRDMMHSLSTALDEVRSMAYYDALTGLPNRRFFLERLSHSIRSHNAQEPVGVLFLDLDGFKAVNDWLNHRGGDRVLAEAGRRITDSVRPQDTVARFGGDEFMVLLHRLPSPQEAERIAERILEALRLPFEFVERSFWLSTSIGIAMVTSTADKPTDIVHYADIAMYHAKMAGKARYSVFLPEMLDGGSRRSSPEGPSLGADGFRDAQVAEPIGGIEAGQQGGDQGDGDGLHQRLRVELEHE